MIDWLDGAERRDGLTHRARRDPHPRVIVVHHTVTTSVEQTFRVLKRPKLTAPFGLSTHFEIGRDAALWQYVAISRRALHAGPWNQRSVGIDVTGPAAYGGHLFDPMQAGRLVDEIRRLAALLGIPLTPETVRPWRFDKALDPARFIGVVCHASVKATKIDPCEIPIVSPFISRLSRFAATHDNGRWWDTQIRPRLWLGWPGADLIQQQAPAGARSEK